MSHFDALRLRSGQSSPRNLTRSVVSRHRRRREISGFLLPFGKLRVVEMTFLLLIIVPAAWAEYQAKGKRDPLIPLLTPSGQRIFPPGYDEEAPTGISGLRLQGIVFDPKADSYAIINDQIVRQQEEVDGFQVVRIDAASVTLLAEGETHQLFLENPIEEPAGEAAQEPTEEVRIP